MIEVCIYVCTCTKKVINRKVYVYICMGISMRICAHVYAVTRRNSKCHVYTVHLYVYWDNCVCCAFIHGHICKYASKLKSIYICVY